MNTRLIDVNGGHIAVSEYGEKGRPIVMVPGMGAAAERPDVVRSVVLIGPFVHADKTPLLMKSMFWLLMHNPWRVRSWTGYYKSLFPSRKPDDFDDYLTRLSSSLKGRGRIDAAYQFGRADLAEADSRLARLSMPTLVIMGSKDPDFADPAAEAERTARESGGELRMIEGAGHYPQTEMPEAANPEIIEFIKRCA